MLFAAPGLLASHCIVLLRCLLVGHALTSRLDDVHPDPTAVLSTLRGVRLRDERYRIRRDPLAELRMSVALGRDVCCGIVLYCDTFEGEPRLNRKAPSLSIVLI